MGKPLSPIVSVHHDPQTKIDFITLSNGCLSATFLNFGARFYAFFAPDKYGKSENICLSLATPQDILNDPAQFGAFIGPVAGRIKEAQWQDVHLEKNHGSHHIHGGSQGWSNQFWEYAVTTTDEHAEVTFSLNDECSGYPGPIAVTTTYTLTTKAVIMKTTCTTKKKTIVNPTNHVYFNLSGNAKEDITKHQLQIQAAERLELDGEQLPTGKMLPVKGTGYDFQEPTFLDEVLTTLENGLDDAYCLKQIQPTIVLTHPTSGRQLRIHTNRQAVVVFSTTGFDLPLPLSEQQTMRSQLGIALETQELPDVVNHPHFGAIELLPGEQKVFQTTYEIELQHD